MHCQTFLVFIFILATLGSNNSVESKCIKDSSFGDQKIITTTIAGEAYINSKFTRKPIPGHFRTNFPPF